VLTFDRHPASVVSGKDVPLIGTRRQSEKWLREIGRADEVVFLPFSESVRDMHWRDFLRDVVIGRFGALHVVCGENFRFGKGGGGRAFDLSDECERSGVGCDIVKSVTLSGETVSSTRVRASISEGDMEEVFRLLGRPYSIDGAVESGRKYGRTISAPTINIPFPEGLCQPKFGVYIAAVSVKSGERLPAVLNFGVRPTFRLGSSPMIEAHILGFSGELYGENVTVEFLSFVRPEEAFPSNDALASAIARDISKAEEFFKENGV